MNHNPTKSGDLHQIAADAASRGWTYLTAHVLGSAAPQTPTDLELLKEEAGIMHALLMYSGSDAFTVDRVTALLECRQALDGAWRNSPDDSENVVEITGWAVLALDRSSANRVSRGAAHRGRHWLNNMIDKGADKSLSDFSRALVLAALIGHRTVKLSAIQARRAQGLVNDLAQSQRADGRWIRPDRDGNSDPKLTSQAVSAMRLAERFVSPMPVRVDDALQSLIDDQEQVGYWSDGQSTDANVAVSAAATSALLEQAHGQETVARGISWLIETQEEGGGWQINPLGGGRPSLKATQLAMLALDRFAASHSDHSAEPEDVTLQSAAIPHADLYDFSLSESWHGLPQTRPLDHTMFRALDRYAAEKVPGAHIEETLLEGGTIEIHGVYPTHFEEMAEQRGLSSIKAIDFNRKPPNKKFNCVRPHFFQARRDGNPVLAASVIPGRDYFFHYATIVRHFAHGLTEDVTDILSLIRYPIAERSLASWTDISDRFVRPGDRVLLGYVEEIAALLDEGGRAEQLGYEENDFYGSYRYRMPDGSILNLLGVKYCFWGSISASLVESICSLGATEIIYLAKLGAISSPDDIYARVFAPDTFYLVYRDVVINKVKSPPNHILDNAPQLSTGAHVSVPTVLEEDYRMRRTITDLGAQSIDNEIAQMAEAVTVYNIVRGAEISFSALHFATDYIRSEHERSLSTTFDLGNDKSDLARSNKNMMVRRIADEVLFPYLEV